MLLMETKRSTPDYPHAIVFSAVRSVKLEPFRLLWRLHPMRRASAALQAHTRARKEASTVLLANPEPLGQD
jgi:hypothetical protein